MINYVELLYFFLLEAEYAFQLKKKIIPLKMEGGYKADGWLGFIIGAKLFYDFSGKYAFENKMKELMKDVQTSLQEMTDTATILPNTDIKVQVLRKLYLQVLLNTGNNNNILYLETLSHIFTCTTRGKLYRYNYGY